MNYQPMMLEQFAEIHFAVIIKCFVNKSTARHDIKRPSCALIKYIIPKLQLDSYIDLQTNRERRKCFSYV